MRHCINCFKDVEGAVAAEDAVLQGSLDLFCSLECERSWSIKSSSGWPGMLTARRAGCGLLKGAQISRLWFVVGKHLPGHE